MPTFVSLNPCLDAILVEVSNPEQVLALSHYSRDPAASSMDVEEAGRYAVTGGTAEEVIALQPDIVLASSFMDPVTKTALERAGMRVETFGSPASVEESAEQVLRMGEMTGGNRAASSLARDMTFPLWPPLSTPPAPPEMGWEPIPDPSLLLWQPGQIVAGEGTLIAQIIREEGFSNYAAERGLRQADHVPLERIVSDPPEVLLVAGDSAGQRHPALANLNIRMVAAFDPRLFYCGGRSIIEARERLSLLRESFEDF
ncbi:MAG: ABC transporter substrate-binding protein [Erythrobacter sp.]